MKNILRKVKSTVLFYRNLISLLYRILTIIFKFHHNTWMRNQLVFECRRFFDSLDSNDSLVKTTSDSKEAYELYDDREIIMYYNGSQIMLMDNSPTLMSYKREREIHLSYIYAEIDLILKKKSKALILEVGCGNCINIFEILSKYGDRVEVHGIDISPGRINVAKRYFKAGLDAAQLAPASITEKTKFSENQFDLVYSMFCIEQISYDTKMALQEMYRICGGRIVMLEPVFENGTILQKIYLILSDHTRIILKSIKELGLPLIKNEVLSFQFNPSNQSTLLVVEKAR